MQDRHDLDRFVAAQSAVYPQVVDELGGGRKASHWMWFVFPQLKALGRSATAMRFGIAGRDEAAAYLAHPLLGARLLECTRLMLAVDGKSALEILGRPDDLKFRSSMTLFAAVAADASDAVDASGFSHVFAAALAKYFDGQPDAATIALLAGG